MTDDFIQKILLESLHIRVIVASLSNTCANILQQHHYPEQIANLVSESVLCSALLAANLKFNGELTLQIRQDDFLKLLVAKCTHDFRLRALIQWDQEVPFPEQYQSLSAGQLVVTVMPDDSVEPYQSIIPLTNNSIQANLEQYFLQSEQLATRFFLASSEQQTWGILMQLLPGGDIQDLSTTQRHIVEGCHAGIDSFEALLAVLQQVDPDLRIFPSESAAFSCRCNQQKMEDAILLLGEHEINDILAHSAYVEITCEYCNHLFQMTRNDIEHVKSLRQQAKIEKK